MTILIVDDTADNRLILNHALKGAGIADVRQASTATEAFDHLGLETDGASECPVDLILMDVMMPGIDGIEACRRIKSDPRFKDVPVIMVTGLKDVDTLQQAFDAGAMDYIVKPINRVEILARVRSALALKKEIDRRKSRENEIAQIGARIQDVLLYSPPPVLLSGMGTAALTIPSQQIDGDFYDFYRHNDQCLDILVADVMGKGIPAALLGAAAKTHFLRAMTHLAKPSDRGQLPSPEDIVMEVHRRMTPELMRLGSFITFCYARVDRTTQSIEFIDGGHMKTIHHRPGNGAYTHLKGENSPLGFDEFESYRSNRAELHPGDILLFYSDGVTDARNDDGDFFGEKKLEACIRTRVESNPQRIIDCIRESVDAFTGGRAYTDDLTCVAVTLEEGRAGIPAAKSTMEISSDLGEVKKLREFIRDFCKRSRPERFDEAPTGQMELAVHETAVNIIKHSYSGQPGQPIRIEAECSGDRLAIHFYHSGKPFRPDNPASLPAGDLDESGYGLYIIENIIDRCDYNVDESGECRITLEKDHDF